MAAGIPRAGRNGGACERAVEAEVVVTAEQAPVRPMRAEEVPIRPLLDKSNPTDIDWELVISHGQLLRNIAGNILRTLPPHAGVDRADLVDAGMLALIEASRRFDARRGIKFATFAGRGVHGAMFDWLRKTDRERSMLSIDADPAWRDKAFAARDQEREQENEVEAPASYAWLWRLVKRLPERTQRILRLYYGEDDWNDEEIGSHIGLSRSRVLQLRKGALARLRRLARKESVRTEGKAA